MKLYKTERAAKTEGHIRVCTGVQGTKSPGARRIGAGIQSAGPPCRMDVKKHPNQIIETAIPREGKFCKNRARLSSFLQMLDIGRQNLIVPWDLSHVLDNRIFLGHIQFCEYNKAKNIMEA